MKKKLGVLLLLALLVIGAFLLTGCSSGVVNEPTIDEQQAQQTEKIMNELQNEVGMPDIQNFYEKKLLKEMYELRDDSELITYTYTKNLDGLYIYEGMSIGYGLPYSTQFSNPEKVLIEDNSYDAGDIPYTVPQAEPNGLFVAEGMSATWVMLINEETGEIEPAYMESEIHVFQSKRPRRLCVEGTLPDDY